jgi:predicted enzyme related to lactoylglutathione lyase
MPLIWEQTVVDADDARMLGAWWAEALGWVIVDEGTEADVAYVEIRSSPEALPGLFFLDTHDARMVKNRLHLDFRPDDQAAEVDRLIALGARPVDIGQGEVGWVVLADPEGNEFCVLSDGRTRTAAGPAE